MNKQNDGFILLLTLGIIFVLSLLLLTCMQHVLVYHKALNRQSLQHQNFYQLEKRVMHLARSDFYNKNCVMYNTAANKVIKKLTQNEGCPLLIAGLSYQYIIEDLGEFPCLVVLYKNKKYATHHFRINLMLLAEERSIIQVRYIKPVALLRCLGEEHVVNTGISSWRYFADLSY